MSNRANLNGYDDDPVRGYLDEMSKVPPITGDRERDCMRHIRARDEQADRAMKDLVEANLVLVVAIAEKHRSEHIHILDLIIHGNNALMQAVRAFADSGSHNFTAYATPFIERAIEHAVATRQNG
jgi:RNA polymerase primary sigma factor